MADETAKLASRFVRELGLKRKPEIDIAARKRLRGLPLRRHFAIAPALHRIYEDLWELECEVCAAYGATSKIYKKAYSARLNIERLRLSLDGRFYQESIEQTGKIEDFTLYFPGDTEEERRITHGRKPQGITVVRHYAIAPLLKRMRDDLMALCIEFGGYGVNCNEVKYTARAGNSIDSVRANLDSDLGRKSHEAGIEFDQYVYYPVRK